MTRRAIVTYPELEHMECIEGVRRAYDPLAAHIRPHVTLVFPFESALATETLAAHMRETAAGIGPFQVALRKITGHLSEYLFLNVIQGNDTLIALHDQLYTGPLAAFFVPDQTYFPHLTVGRLSALETFEAALAEARRMTGTRVFAGTVRAITIYQIATDGDRAPECQIEL